MAAQLIYLLVVLIWATTPLAIKLGGESFSPMAGLTLRIGLAFIVGSAICTIGGYATLNIRKHGKLYFAAAVSLFPNMALVYVAAEHISSGLIALMFGLSPFSSALLSGLILGESALQPRKLLAIFLASIGLLLILFEGGGVESSSAYGIGLMLASNFLFAGSALWVKRLNRTLAVAPVEQALGSMVFALPGLLISWFFIFGFEVAEVSTVSLVSLIYLGLVGSLGGLVAYYYILNQFSAEAVSLVPLVTPILAMLLGVLIADETISLAMMSGAALILVALVIHQRLWRVFVSKE
ncbi:MAG: DMT family transporter [Porticoccaceae bacterium]|nr:DMT family transporter [Pseudomonadales bacterium]MCP5172201.1 DMT family transporter [Pseudomonadales bacterium]